MKTIYLILALAALSLTSRAQENNSPLLSSPYIEVTGESELEIVPDEIYARFTLIERMEGRTKTELARLEKDMKKQLSASGFDLENLSLADAGSDYITIRRKKQDVLASRDYQFKLTTTDQLQKLWDILDEVKAQNAFIARVDHSQMKQFEKEVKMKAAVNAKEKASYLLEALDQQCGKVLFLQERENYATPYLRTKTMMAVSPAFEDEAADSPAESPIQFQKIKLNYKVFARFAIQ